MRNPATCRCLFVLAMFFWSRAALAAPPVVTTDPLSPAEQQKKFKLPPGFEIQLVASEPEIQKPMNLNFDTRGRLWVSHSIEYPWPAADPAKARDAVTILSDIGPDGKAKSVKRFAENLNIPIGILPLKAGKEAILWSIPNIWKYTDTDGDDKADKREIMFGPFDYADTHGNQNGFRYHLDGWIYANHGFRNQSKVKIKGEGLVVLEMNSGNTYRFKPDGSAIELWSQGQVNPFGLTFDPWGNLFSADCHSKACTMLLRGGCYQSFGRQHDGLGFAPEMTNHDHGSSGVGGIAYYAADHFPKEYRDCLYLGNVVNCKVQRDVIEWRGSTPWVDKPVDFVTCDDEWFRPVDIQLGPDGALYIADFYNCIIGHYEVDLKHPKRDRARGRIWRVVWKGTAGTPRVALRPLVDLTKLSTSHLVTALGDQNIVFRSLATQVALDSSAVKTKDVVGSLGLEWMNEVHAYWIIERTEGVQSTFHPERRSPPSVIAMGHIYRMFSERKELAPYFMKWAQGGLESVHPIQVRLAADALSRHPHPSNVGALLTAWSKADAQDLALIHTIRIALRNNLRDMKDLAALREIKLEAGDRAKLAEIALAVPSEAAAWFAFEHVRSSDLSADAMGRYITHVARYVGDARVDEVAAFVKEKFKGDIDAQLPLFTAIHSGVKQRGGTINADSALGRWAATLAEAMLDPKREVKPSWTSESLDPTKPSPSPFGPRERKCADGQSAIFLDSIVGGETLTGVMRSTPFTIPKKLTFYLCGHNGIPGSNPPATNHVRLKLADSGEIIAQQTPPRNDIAHKYTWDLSKWAGKRGAFEIVDAQTGAGYAWLAVARFEPAVLAIPSDTESGNKLALAAQIAGDLKLAKLSPQVLRVLGDAAAGMDARLAAAQASISLNRVAAIESLGAIAARGGEPAPLRIKAAQSLGVAGTAEARAALSAALIAAPATLQQPFAMALASNADGADALLKTIADGKASPRLLQDKAVLDRVNASNPSDKDARLAALTKNLQPADARLNQLIADRSTRFAAWRSTASPANLAASIDKGAAVFKQNCAACHQLAGQGNKVGPQLDGIGARGHERLLEDIIDPNRNVDAAFRPVIVTKKDGDQVTGLKLREEGKLVVLADSQGKEMKISSDEISETRPSSLSLMPTNLVEVIKESDLFDLLAFLTAVR